MTSQSDLEADRSRLHAALGLDVDAHLDLLADAAVALRAENEWLKVQKAELDGAVESLSRLAEEGTARIAQLEAALREVEAEHVVPIAEMSVECLQQTLTWKMATAGAALKGDADDNEG